MLSTGASLGPYRILVPLGAGGMGEVYRAHDTRLGRDVAIKVLSGEWAAAPEARARFEREARTISRLNHPHICTLHDVGRDRDADYLVMELVEGETLAARLTRGPLPLSDVLELGGQIAAAMAAAHRSGIVHRDLKPGNIMLTSSGVKLLDFGLSRPIEPAGNAAVSGTPTVALPLTGTGEIVGTLQYMAPEQLAGREADARSDVFALGCVLYEMATARRPFTGDDHVGMLSSILRDTPAPLSRSEIPIPRSIERLIARCLEKEPGRRFASATELGAELAEVRGWVQREALPELERIVDRIQVLGEGPDPWAAFALAREIEALAPEEPRLAALWPEFSHEITIESSPPGASVYARYYRDFTGGWTLLGRTPLRKFRYPAGFTRIRLELANHQVMHDVIWNLPTNAISGATDPASGLWQYELLKPDEIPGEMERIPSGGFPLSMPGLDHLAKEPTAAFLFDRHPVTNREFKRFMDAGGYEREEYWQEPFAEQDRALSRLEGMARFTDAVGRAGPATWELGEYPAGEDDHPVTGVSWFEAAAYARWAGKELPTLFHWNRVAFTVGSSEIVPVANFSGRGVVAVGTTPSVNRFGVHDLAGNVREWSANECDRPGQHFILGGGWNDPEYAFADAYAQPAFDRSPTNGFRCIRSLEPESNRAALARKIQLPFRDFHAETPVSDEIFSFFLRQFRYDPLPLDAVIAADEDGPLARQQTIHMNAAYGGERMMAQLYLPPRGRPPYQTVVLFPGSGALHVKAVGHAEMRRSEFLLKSGRAVLLPIYKGTYQRSDDLKSDYPDESASYRDHVIMWAKDLGRAIDYLETRDDIDAGRLAYYGLSWGGAMGAIMPAVEKRIRAIVLYVAGLNFQRALPEVDQIHYVTRVTQPTLMLNADLDFYFPAETSQRPMFELLGTPNEHKQRLTYPGGHSVPRADLIKETLAWLDRYLGPTR